MKRQRTQEREKIEAYGAPILSTSPRECQTGCDCMQNQSLWGICLYSAIHFTIDEHTIGRFLSLLVLFSLHVYQSCSNSIFAVFLIFVMPIQSLSNFRGHTAMRSLLTPLLLL